MKSLKEILKEIEEASPHNRSEYEELIAWFKKLEWALRKDHCKRFGIGQ